MSDYQQFKQALEISVKHNIKLSHINIMLSKGYNKVEFLQSASGVLTFRFFGRQPSSGVFKAREDFYKESKSLVSQEPLGYALLNSCIDAENSTIDLGIPQTYKVILEVSGESSYRCTISVPMNTQEKSSLKDNPSSNYTLFKVHLEGYLDEKIRRANIDSVLKDGFRYVKLQISADGKLRFVFGGENSYIRGFNSLEDFYRKSECFEDREGFCYNLVESCVSAEKSTNGDIPSSYNITCHIAENGDFSYKIG